MYSNSPPLQPLRKLPVFRTVKQAWGTLLRNPSALLTAAALPFALSLGTTWLVHWLEPSGGMVGPVAPLLLVLSNFVCSTLFAVAWHRFLLLGPEEGRPTLVPAWRARHWRFLAYGLGLIVILALIGILLAAVACALVYLAFLALGFDLEHLSQPTLVGLSVLLTLLFIFFTAFLSVRLLLVFPALAVDERFSFRDSWRTTKGQVFRYVAALLLTLLPVLIIYPWLVSHSMAAWNWQEMGTGVAPPLSWPFEVAFSVIGIAASAVAVSVLSIMFRSNTGWVPRRPESLPSEAVLPGPGGEAVAEGQPGV